jgi:hypothetical protein
MIVTFYLFNIIIVFSGVCGEGGREDGRLQGADGTFPQFPETVIDYMYLQANLVLLLIVFI